MEKDLAAGKPEPEGQVFFYLRLTVRGLAPLAWNLAIYSFGYSVLGIVFGIAAVFGMVAAADVDLLRNSLQRRKARRKRCVS